MPRQILKTLPEATDTASLEVETKLDSELQAKLLPEATHVSEEPKTSLQEATRPQERSTPHVAPTTNPDLTDSDATIIYDPQEYSNDTCKRVFTTVTQGIKITKRVRMYTCPKCGIKKTSVQSVKEHYK